MVEISLLQNVEIQEFLQRQWEIWMYVFVYDGVRYILGVGLVYLTLNVIFRKWSLRYKIQSKSAKTKDLFREISYSLMTICVYATIGLFTVYGMNSGWLRIYSEINQYGILYLLISLPILLILHDTYFYWVHRAMHHPILFRRVHHLHHLSRTPTPWAAYSFSPFEASLMALFVPLILFFVPIHKVILFVFLGIMIIRNAMGHSGIEFHPVFWVDTPLDMMTTTTHHDLHHQDFKGNFGLYFTWWDRWMGTELPHYKTRFKAAAKAEISSANKL